MEFTDREITILRRAVSWYASTGADGMSTEAWKVYRDLLAEDVRRAAPIPMNWCIGSHQACDCPDC